MGVKLNLTVFGIILWCDLSIDKIHLEAYTVTVTN